jgi:hypothetical protein
MLVAASMNDHFRIFDIVAMLASFTEVFTCEDDIGICGCIDELDYDL